jgi:hypothetical protein
MWLLLWGNICRAASCWPEIVWARRYSVLGTQYTFDSGSCHGITWSTDEDLLFYTRWGRLYIWLLLVRTMMFWGICIILGNERTLCPTLQSLKRGCQFPESTAPFRMLHASLANSDSLCHGPRKVGVRFRVYLTVAPLFSVLVRVVNEMWVRLLVAFVDMVSVMPWFMVMDWFIHSFVDILEVMSSIYSVRWRANN